MTKRKIDLVAATSIVVANMVGTGVFTSLGFQLYGTQAGFPILLIWLLGGVLALLGAFCYAELATRLPEDGGEYYFLSKIYHPALGFMAGFVSSTVGFAAPVAAAALALGAYLNGVVPGIDARFTAAIVVLFIAIIHIINVSAGISFQKVFTIIKVVIIICFVALGLYNGNVSHIQLNPTAFSYSELVNPALAVSLVWVSFAYSGWNASAYIAGEIIEPEKNMSRSILFGAGIVTVMYILLNLVFMMSTPAAEMIGKKEIGLIASNYIFGSRGGSIMGALISVLLISTISSMIFAGPRVLQPMFAKISAIKALAKYSKNNNPVRAILFQTILSLILMFTINFDSLINYIAFTLSIFTVLTVAGMVVLRVKQGKPVGYKAWGYPVTPIVFILATLCIGFYFVHSNPKESMYGLATALLGLLLYFFSDDAKAKQKL